MARDHTEAWWIRSSGKGGGLRFSEQRRVDPARAAELNCGSHSHLRGGPGWGRPIPAPTQWEESFDGPFASLLEPDDARPKARIGERVRCELKYLRGTSS